MSIEFLSRLFEPMAVSIESSSSRGSHNPDGIGRCEILAALNAAEHRSPDGADCIKARYMGDQHAMRRLLAKFPENAVLSAIGMLTNQQKLLSLYKRYNPFGRREAKRARELELIGKQELAEQVRQRIAERCLRDTQGGICPACNGTGELQKPKPHTCPNCRGGKVEPPTLTQEERHAEAGLLWMYGDAAQAFYSRVIMERVA